MHTRKSNTIATTTCFAARAAAMRLVTVTWWATRDTTEPRHGRDIGYGASGGRRNAAIAAAGGDTMTRATTCHFDA